MDYIEVFKCLCDVQRLRILNLLREGPLCVCHLMEILDAEQVKISKQLKYLKDHGMVEAERDAQWMIYRLADPENRLLQENLSCLQDCAAEELGLAADLARRAEIIQRLQACGELDKRPSMAAQLTGQSTSCC